MISFGGTSTGSQRLDLRIDNTPIVTLVEAARVGVSRTNPVAKLDVAGEVKIASSGLPCSATTEGSLRYNTALNRMQFCDGTSWTLVGGFSTCISRSGAAGSTSIATCAAGEMVTGGGFTLVPGPGGAYGLLISSRQSGNGWSATMANFRATAHAVCCR